MNKNHVIALVLIFVICAPLHAQEICGLQLAKYDLPAPPEPIFRNGFENILAFQAALTESKISVSEPAKGTGLGPALTTVLPPALGVTPTITVTSPTVGASIARTVQVQGTWTGPVNTGITVFGVAATVIGNQFVSEPLQLAPGNTEITVRAKTLDGLSATQT